MRIPQQLIEPHQQTYREIYHRIFEPSASEPLEWREVRKLFREIGQVTWQANGDQKVTRNGHVLILHPRSNREVSVPEDLLELQRFLEYSEETLAVDEAHEDPVPAVLLPQSLSAIHAR